jgi:peptide deformylase
LALRRILTVNKNEAELRRISKPIVFFDKKLADLLDDLLETLHATDDGAAIAAPQVGVLRRVVVIDLGEGVVEMVNPEILETKGEAEFEEGCLSLPGIRGRTKRPAYVKAKAYDRHGVEFTVEGTEIMALALVHEIGHLDGKLFTDYVEGELWEVEG